MGGRIYKAHEMVYAGSLIRCGHCGNLITGETVTKKNGKQYVYYRCTMYNRGDHPRIRLNAGAMDGLMVGIFNRIRQPDTVREWFAYELRQNTDANQAESRQRADELQGQLARLRKQEDELLNLRLSGEIEQTTYRSKSQELRDRVARLTVQLETIDRSRDEKADAALRVFELSQALPTKWLTADYAEKRTIMHFLFLNLRLEGIKLIPELHEPFEQLFKGLNISSSRGDKI